MLNLLDQIERDTRPSLGSIVREKDYSAYKALRIAGDLVNYVAGWAIDHQRGLAQQGVRFSPYEKFLFHPSEESHKEEIEGASRGPLDPVQARRFLFNMLFPMAAALSMRTILSMRLKLWTMARPCQYFKRH